MISTSLDCKNALRLSRKSCISVGFCIYLGREKLLGDVAGLWRVISSSEKSFRRRMSHWHSETLAIISAGRKIWNTKAR